MTPMRIGTRSLRALRRTFVPLALLLAASPAWAVLIGVGVSPQSPTPCDTVIAKVVGALPSPCYEIIGASIRGPEPIPCMRPGPCPSQFHIDIIVREPNPDPPQACPAISPTYERTFGLEPLTAGEYTVLVHERFVPFSVTDSIVSESFLSTSFTARPDSICPPTAGCYIIALTAPPVAYPLNEPRWEPRCTVAAPPGGTACLNVAIQNERAIAGLQTTLRISDFTKPGTPIAIPVVSVQPFGRAAGFQVAHTTEGQDTKIILYSTNGATIEPGSGPLVEICYAIPPEPVPPALQVAIGETIVADPLGNGVPPCPTVASGFAATGPAIICIEKPGCDLNGDGVSDVLDVIRLVRCALATDCPDSVAIRADCNGDGAIDIRDVICCVRKIVDAMGQTVRPANPRSLAKSERANGETSIGFESGPYWTSQTEGVAIIRIDAADDFGGVQFSIDPGGAPVRIGGMTLEGMGAHPGVDVGVEGGVDAWGVAHGVVFGIGPRSRQAQSIGVILTLIRKPSGGNTDPLRLIDLKAGNASGTPAPVSSFKPVLELANTVVSAPMLLKARPNPSAGGTEIGFVLPGEARVTLRIYDVSGRLVRTLVDGPRTPGVHRVQWDGADGRGRTARSGIYFARFEAGSIKRSERILLMR